MTEVDDEGRELALNECWALIEQEQVGRLAYRLVDEIHIVPINHVARDGSLFFRTAAGNKLLAAALQEAVAFEIDWFGEAAAWSVEVRGRLRHVADDEHARLDDTIGIPWVPGSRSELVALTPAHVSGRSFGIRRPGSQDAG